MSINNFKLRVATFASFLVALVCTFLCSPAQAKTVLQVYNSTNTAVDVWMNSTNPSAKHVKVTLADGTELPIFIPSVYVNGEKGVFSLPAGQTATITRKAGGDVLNGTITFNCIPICPCGGVGQSPCPQLSDHSLPTLLINGVNQGEYSLNSGFESVDISCVNGSMCSMAMTLTGGSPLWANNITGQVIQKIGNFPVDVAKRKDGNCTAIGVFPFNATDCIKTPNPPCGTPICFHAQRDCQLDRQGSGGTVTITVIGFEAQ